MSQSPSESLHTSFPWLQSPLIVNAPMGGIAGPKLAVAVSRAGGFGLIGMDDPSGSKLGPWLDEASQFLKEPPVPLQSQSTSSASSPLPYLPIGVGFLLTFMKLDLVMAKLKARTSNSELPPAVIWLFAADEPSIDAYIRWATTIREHYSSTGQYVPQIWIQVGGSAKAVVDLALSKAQPDVLVVQGSDAGGHGMERGASIIGLLPEVLYMLDQAFATSGRNENSSAATGKKRPHILASGGIVDSAGVLAALSLGAEGVIMGTRFLASPETAVPHPEFRNRVLAARDGAQCTIRAKIFDELRGPNAWPVAYDGRALVSRSWRDQHEDKVPIETIRDGFAKAVKEKDGGFGVESDRAVIWCGTGVGLVNEVKPAGNVVRETREGVKRLLEEMARKLGVAKL